MSEIHPAVIAARESEQEVRRNIHAGVGPGRLGAGTRTTSPRKTRRIAPGTARRPGSSPGTAPPRFEPPYGSNLAEAENRAELLRQAEDDLSRAEVSQVGADAASLIGRIDVPTVGTRPAGPGRNLIILVGAIGGLLTGLGFLVLTSPMPGSEWGDGPRKSRGGRCGRAPPTVQRRRDSRPPNCDPRHHLAWSPPDAVLRLGSGRSESELLTSLEEDMRMPENDLRPESASGMTLKEALQRVGSA